MASTYHLLCFDCRRYLSLGKLYWLSSEGAPLGEIRLDGVYDAQRKRWTARDDLFGRAIEGFLIRHRNHEIRFVPEGVDELLETPAGAVQPLEAEVVVAPQQEGDVDPSGELEDWRRRLGR